MERTPFESQLQQAGQQAIKFARLFVRQNLPDDMAFLVHPNQSCDINPRKGDEIIFPNESLPEGQHHGPWSVAETTSFLWRDGKIPEWVDVAVKATEKNRTLIRLTCCGRFSASEDLWYHHPSGIPPFSVKSPDLPPWWHRKDDRPSGRFHLDWRERRFRLKMHRLLFSPTSRLGLNWSKRLGSLLIREEP